MRRRGWQRPFVKSVKFYTESKTQQPSKSAATFSLSSDTPPTASIFSAPVPCHCTPYPNAQAKGWDTMERALDGFDKQQVEDYKDDIDTLLVFAGLYSAVLTAFVIESYPLLQEDTAGESLQVLRQIATQSAGYVILGGQLVNTTATVPSPSLSQFEPTPAAVRLNVLWFASLVLSLSTASLGIMVKQWLREYMSFTTSSAQGHLRVRAYRRSGLETWKVFGIASTLPLLLQLSLLLFFVGLCDFTANVHPSIRNTTLSLVCAWAFLIFSVVLAPIFSARCPYKTPALKPMTTAIRVRVYLPIAVIAAAVWRRILLFTAVQYVKSRLIQIPQLLSRVLVSRYHKVKRLTFRVNRGEGNDYDENNRDMEEEDEADLEEDTHSVLDSDKLLEEADIIKYASNDLDILATADALQANDELLGTTMKAALEQSEPTWEKVTEFLLKVMGNRIPAVPLASDEPTLIDVRSLSLHARQALQDILVLHVPNAESFGWFRTDLKSYDLSKRRAISWVIHLYVSLLQDSVRMTGSHRRFFLECVVGEAAAMRRILHHAKNGKRVKAWVLSLACQVCRDSDDAELVNALALLTKIVRLVGPMGVFAHWTLPEESVHCLFEQFHHMTTFEASLRLADSSSDRDSLARAVCLVLNLFGAGHTGESSLQWDNQFARLGPKLYTSASRELLQSFLHGCIMQTPTYILKTVRDPQSTLWGLTCADYNAEAIARLEVALDYLTSDLTRPLDATEALALCCIIARLAASVGTCVSYGVSGGTVHCWRPVFNILADLLRKCKGYTHRSLSDVCWTSIAKIDEAWFQPSSSRSNAGPPEHDARLQQFKESDSAAGDYFCSVLMTLTFHNDLVGESWRARRLSGMTDFEREELERRGEAEAILERECRSA